MTVVISLKNRMIKCSNGIRNAIYPANVHSFWLVAAIPASLHFTGRKVPFDLTNKIVEIMPSNSLIWEVIACGATGLIVWLPLCFALRKVTKCLLSYKGFMYETRGRPVSLMTRLWALSLKVLTAWNKPLLYSFQGLMPTLPLPSVKDTMQRYLRSVRPLLDDENYDRMTGLAKDFEQGLGKRLQRYLRLKHFWSKNYVSDWWEEYVYLRCRGPLMIKSNFYGTCPLFVHPTCLQAARAANNIALLLTFRQKMDRQDQRPIMAQGMVPLCSKQYERMFNMTRVPGIETDRIVHYQNSDHIAVYHKGRYYKVVIYYRNRLLRACEIQVQIKHILNDDATPAPGEKFLASLTAGDRTKWAEIRESFFASGANKEALQIVESAAFFVALDDYAYQYDANDSNELDNYGRMMLHGKGYDRWYDKSFNLCIGSNGRVGFNAEHSWADAPIISQAMEWTVAEDITSDCYDENGNCKGVPEFIPPTPTRIVWDLKDAACLAAIEDAQTSAETLIKDLDLTIFLHDAFGKGVMKKCRLSPDAFIQMALQLAYFRDTGKFSLTYEASMTRLFLEGRTETVRSCTNESTAWVKAMSSPNRDTVECVKLLRAACDQHQNGYRDAMCGKGIDRHLFCLYVISKYLKVDSPFLQAVLGEPWLLSTSQTPHDQTNKLNTSKNPQNISAGGGFGTVSEEGYGVCYMVAGEGMVFFHVTASKGCDKTDAKRFSQQIGTALKDIKELFEDYNKQNMRNGTGSG